MLFLVSVAMFGLIHLMPGGPVGVFLNPRLSAAGRAAIEKRFGLDQPLPVQYIKWLLSALQGDFGFSFVTNEPVTQVLGEHFPATLELFASALLVALIFAIFLGTISAVRQGTSTDYIVTTISYFGISMPIFLLGLMAQDVFAVWLHWLPTSGTSTAGIAFDPFNAAWDHFNHLLMPMLVLATTFLAGWSRYMRSSMREVRKQDYIRTARAKGASDAAVNYHHALKNAILPVITVIGIEAAFLIGGLIVTETVFNIPGVAHFLVEAIRWRDYPIVQNLVMFIAVVVVFANFTVDMLYAVFDPRIRYTD